MIQPSTQPEYGISNDLENKLRAHLNKEWVTKSQSTLEILAESIIKETNETIAKFGYINHENCRQYY